MHVIVNETNIAVFELVKFTGNTREELLQHAADAEKNGYILTCQIPDPDEPIRVNAFDHFDPDSPAEESVEGEVIKVESVRVEDEE